MVVTSLRHKRAVSAPFPGLPCCFRTSALLNQTTAKVPRIPEISVCWYRPTFDLPLHRWGSKRVEPKVDGAGQVKVAGSNRRSQRKVYL